MQLSSPISLFLLITIRKPLTEVRKRLVLCSRSPIQLLKKPRHFYILHNVQGCHRRGNNKPRRNEDGQEMENINRCINLQGYLNKRN